jgi:hypothetical protein
LIYQAAEKHLKRVHMISKSYFYLKYDKFCLHIPMLSRNLLPLSAVFKTLTLEMEAVGHEKVWYLQAKKAKVITAKREVRAAEKRVVWVLL